MPDASPSEPSITLPSGPDAARTDAAQSVPMTPPDESPRWIVGADWLLLALVAVLGFLVASVPALNSDVWMQLATGRLIAHGEYAFGADPFSYATEAVPWVNHSWLFALGLYVFHGLAGGIGVIIAKGVLVVALVAVLVQVRARGANLLVGAVCLALGVLALSTRLPLQPILFSYLFLSVTLLLLQRAGVFALAADVDSEPAGQGVRGLWFLPALFVLWVNLDNWFVLGPITIALCWLGLALQRWRGQPVRVPLGRLGAVLGVGLLACVLNPFHVRAFQLPPELAYVLVRGTDAVGLPVPDALVAGGRTMSAIHAFEPEILLTASPLAPGFWKNPHVGFNIAGIAFFTLLGLGLCSFVLNGVAALQAGGPAPQGARLIVWLFFALLAISLYRLIPLFAIVGAAITALNLAELLAWYVRPTVAGAPTPWVAPARLSRVLCVPLMLALILLAWPGWLNGPFDLGARLHVAWDVPVDVSLQKAALALADRVPADAPPAEVRVFNTGVDVAHYCAWFAPGVKRFADGRYNLFPAAIEEYLRARAALKDKSMPARAWSAVFKRYQVGHVAVENFMASPALMTWWEDSDQWLQRFADRKVAVFSWSRGTQRWPADAILDHWNTRAFGPVAPADRPPAGGVPAPQERGLFDRYFFPAPALPESTALMDVESAYSQFVGQKAFAFARNVLMVQTYAMHGQPAAPGALVGPWAMYATTRTVGVLEARGRPFFTMVDAYPPAAPVLMVRQAWTAIGESPDNERCYLFLANAFTRVKAQEGHWISPAGAPPAGLRDMMRRVQIVSALRTAADVGFTDPRLQFQVHRDLADLYFERYYLDLAVDQLTLAAAVLEANPPDDLRFQDDWRKKKAGVEGQRDQLRTEVEKRRNDLGLKTAGRKPLDKARFALGTGYSVFNKKNEQQFDPRGWGLPGTARQFLEQVDHEKLSSEERIVWLRATLDLLFNMGEAPLAATILDKSKAGLGPLALQYRVYRAATQGDYDALRATLAEWERALAHEALKGFRTAFAFGMTAPPANLGQTYCMLALSGSRDPNANWVVAVSTWSRSSEEYFNVKTLRGLTALEAGDTADALQVLQAVLRESDRGKTFYFPDRPIAVRYAPLLARYHKQ